MKHKVLICEEVSFDHEWNQRLDINYQPDIYKNETSILAAAKDNDAIIVRNQTKLYGEFIQSLHSQAPNCRVIGRLGVGLDNIDVLKAKEVGFQVVYSPDANTKATAELTLTLALAALRHLIPAHLSTQKVNWDRATFVGREMREITFGIVGYGRIGQRVAELASAFGSNVLATSRSSIPMTDMLEEVSIKDLLEKADIVSLHVPSTNETQNMISRNELGMMKRNAILINTARGDAIDEAALLEHMENNHDFIACLDVRQKEPPTDATLGQLQNIIMTPHIGAFSTHAQQAVAETVLKDVLDCLDGRLPKYPAPA